MEFITILGQFLPFFRMASLRREIWCWSVLGSRVKWKVRGNDLISRLRKNMDRKIGTFICLSERYLHLQLPNLSTVDIFWEFGWLCSICLEHVVIVCGPTVCPKKWTGSPPDFGFKGTYPQPTSKSMWVGEPDLVHTALSPLSNSYLRILELTQLE